MQGLLVREATQDSGYLPTNTDVIQYFNNSYGHADIIVYITLSPG